MIKMGNQLTLERELESTDLRIKTGRQIRLMKKIVKQIADGTPEKMMSFKEKLNSDEMKALLPVIRSFVKK